MVTNQQFRELALSFPETMELPHFEKVSFRAGKKIFATLDEKNKRACLKLNEIDQDVFSSYDRSIIYPVPNKWGKQGWTFIELPLTEAELLKDAVTLAFCTVAPKRLAARYQ